MPFAGLPGLNLYYEEHGVGPAILLLAGIPAIANDWEPLSLRLAEEGRRVIAYDNRGSGQSSVTPGPYTTAQMADDAVALLDWLQQDPLGTAGYSAKKRLSFPVARRGMLSTTVIVTVGSGHPERASAC